MKPSLFVLSAILLLLPLHAYGQAAQEENSRFGLIISGTPNWTAPDFAKIAFDDPTRLDVRGSEISAGIVIRGRQSSGEWGVMVVKKSIKEGSVVEHSLGESCFGNICGSNKSTLYSQNASWLGAVFHKNVSFGTIGQRVQIGMNFGGGVASVKGTARQVTELNLPMFDPITRQLQLTKTVSEGQVGANEMFLGGMKTQPLGKVELTGSLLVGSNLKLRVSGGFNYPGTQVVSLTAIYFLGKP